MDNRKDRYGREEKHFKKVWKKQEQWKWNKNKNKRKSNDNANNNWKPETNEDTTNEKETN